MPDQPQPRGEATVRPGPDKNVGTVLNEVLEAKEQWERSSSSFATLLGGFDRRIEALRACLEAHGLKLSREQMAAILEGAYVPLDTTDFLSHVGRCLRPSKENFRALSTQFAFDVAVAQLGEYLARTIFGW